MNGVPISPVYGFVAVESPTISVAVLNCICLDAVQIPAKVALAFHPICIAVLRNLRVVRVLMRFTLPAKIVSGRGVQKESLATQASEAIVKAALDLALVAVQTAV